MFGNRKAGKARLMAAASILTLALVALPLEPSLDGGTFDGTAAYAKGNGGNDGGNGGGRGGGHGGGHGGGNSGHGSADSGTDSSDGDDTASVDGPGKAHGKASAPGQNKHGASGFAAAGVSGEEVGTKNHGATASMMGSLNSWTHASANARLHASASSQVGLAREYEQSLLGGNIEDAIQSLLDAANKEVSVLSESQAVVGSINAALDITVDPATADPAFTETPEDPAFTETPEDPAFTESLEDPEAVEPTEDPEVTVAADTVPSRTISQETMDAVVDGFFARDSSLGEIEDETGGEGTTEGEEITAEGEGDGSTVTPPSS